MGTYTLVRTILVTALVGLMFMAGYQYKEWKGLVDSKGVTYSIGDSTYRCVRIMHMGSAK